MRRGVSRVLVLQALLRLSRGCQLVMFRHVQKTGGTSLRGLFSRLVLEPNGWRGSVGWRAAMPFALTCVSYPSWRRAALGQWLDDRARGTDEGAPNLFLEYHVEYDGAQHFYHDLDVARAAQSDRCRVLAVALLRRPDSWVRSMFRHDVRRYRSNAGGPIVHSPRTSHTSEFALRMCDFVSNIRSVWGGLAECRAAHNESNPANADAKKAALQLLLRRKNITIFSDDETPDHVDSQTNALWWRLHKHRPTQSATHENTTFDVLGTTEQIDAFVSELFRRTGHAARPPLDQLEKAAVNAISTIDLRLDNANGTGACPHLAAALRGAPDDIFDAIANASTQDRTMWMKASQHAMPPSLLLPVSALAEPSFEWVVHKVERSLQADNATAELRRLARVDHDAFNVRWDAIWFKPGHNPGDNQTHRSVCIRQRRPHQAPSSRVKVDRAEP